jgi:hypothetical protein
MSATHQHLLASAPNPPKPALARGVPAKATKQGKNAVMASHGRAPW